MLESGLQQSIQTLAVQFPPFILAVVAHEFGHGFMAYRWGDPTAKDQGRMTLNPIPHVDVLGTIILPIMMMASGVHLLFGWAKPVPIDPSRFRRYRPGLFWVSLAGPLANCAIALVSSIFFSSILLWMPRTFYLYEPLITMCVASVTINYALAIFNLLPLPPLDGSKIIQSGLSLRATLKYEQLARYSFFILVALMMTGSLSFLSRPILFLSDITLTGVAHLFHVSEILPQ